MNKEAHELAGKIRDEINEWESALDGLMDEKNLMDLPLELFMRHIKEKIEWVESEIVRLEKKYEAI